MWFLIILMSLWASLAFADTPTLLPVGDSQTVNPSYVNLMPSHISLIDELTEGGALCGDKADDFDTWLITNACPDIVTFMCGTNDCLTNGCENPTEIAVAIAGIEQLVASAQACGAIPIILTVTPLASTYAGDPDHITEIANLAAAQLAAAIAGGYDYVDTYQRMIDYDSVSEMDDLFQGDGYHINAAADLWMSTVINAKLLEYFAAPNFNLFD